MRGFGTTWCEWIKSILVDGTVSVKLNNTMGPYFKSFKGVRQGDPVSPFFFNIAVECLCKMVLQAQKNNLITGLAPNPIDNGVAIL